MLKQPSRPSSAQSASPLANGKRGVIALGVLALVGLGLWFYVAGDDARQHAAGKSSIPGSLSANDGMNGGAEGRRDVVEQPQMMSAAEREKILKKFNATLQEYIRLLRLTVERRKQMGGENPLIEQAWDYGHGQLVTTYKRYEDVLKKHSEYLEAHWPAPGF